MALEQDSSDHMRQRKVLKDNEWTGWIRWYKSAFKQGALMEIWQRHRR